jgi:hypothetical protein
MTSMIENKELNELMNEATAQIEQIKVLHNEWDELLKKNSYKMKGINYANYSNRVYYGINTLNKAKFELTKFIEMLKQDIEYNEYMTKNKFIE